MQVIVRGSSLNEMSQRLDSIQALRAVAAIGVVLGHVAQLEMRFLPDAILGPVWFLGFSGVDLFFLISGFVMVHVTRSASSASPGQAGRFLFARITRIYPPYWLFTLAALAGFALFPGIGTRGLEDMSLWRSVLLYPHTDLPILPIGWTLVHELYFYLIFTGMLFLPRRFLAPGLVVWLAVVVAGGAVGIRQAGALPDLVFNPLTAEFVLGCAIALFCPRGGRVAGWSALAAGVTLFTVAGIIIAPQSHENLPADWLRVGTQGVPCALLAYGIITLERVGVFRSPRWLVAIGDWSYSLYLSHILVLLGGVWMWNRVVPDMGPLDNVVMIAGGMAACLLLAALSYRFFEKPVLNLTHHWRDKLFPSTGPKPSANARERVG